MFGLKKRFKSSPTSSSTTAPPTISITTTENAEPLTSDEDARRKSLINLISPNQVTEESLEVWRALPLKIRHDPSLASFKIEHERLHGSPLPEDEKIPEFIETESGSEHENQESEFITMKSAPEYGGQNKNAINSEGHPDGVEDEENHLTFSKPSLIRKYGKIGFFVIIWILCALSLAANTEKIIVGNQVVVPPNRIKYYYFPELPLANAFHLELIGAFQEESYGNLSQNYLTVDVEVVTVTETNDSTTITDINYILLPWYLPTSEPELYETAHRISKSKKFVMSVEDRELLNEPNTKIRLQLSTNNNSSRLFAFQINYDPSPMNMAKGAICAACILILLYSLIIFEVIHRTFVAVLTSMISISILAFFGNRPTMAEIIKWMDIQPLLLLFCMMILVAVLTETGVFDYLAVLAFEKTGGKIWPLIYCLCIITCGVSSLLDNVTTVLLMAPITIRLCEVMELNPIPMLMGLIVHANIGGILTPIGDPPSLIIYSDPYISKHVTFFSFIEHTAPGVTLAIIQSCIHLRLIFRDRHDLRLKEPKEIKELRREIIVWQRAADSLPSYTKDAEVVRTTLLKKVKILRHKLKKKELAGPVSSEVYRRTLDELKAAYPIKDKNLLIMSGVILVFIITLFFVQSLPDIQVLPLGWVALLGILLLLIISDRNDMDTLMARVEWTTLLFFAGLFVTMESLQRMGLNDWIGQQTENIILFVNKDLRLGLAIFIILWISALMSAFVETLPVTSMMVKVVVSLVERNTLGLPIQPLVWAIAFGPCLGGNGTLYGSSANIVCADIAEQHGYILPFTKFFKIGFPMMFGSVFVTTIYLLFAHVLFQWH